MLNKILQTIYPLLLEEYGVYEYGEFNPIQTRSLDYPFQIDLVGLFTARESIKSPLLGMLDNEKPLYSDSGFIVSMQPDDLSLNSFVFYEMQFYHNDGLIKDPYDVTWEDLDEGGSLTKIKLEGYSNEVLKHFIEKFNLIKVKYIDR